ncbi:Rap1a/Tai family immunity protein [Sulfurisoma sediminicola]|uniref:Rap1a immunity protein domain-containing protein n=1 Tax=Sulfurisoma sediminicola TaxID=1381557 RepID=A0A497XJN3_9PROT|nr:Rap1a/Tai family immunity protein [Sulfurisoma sediminicola]RLJ67597.1 hypothetical protein DFR35_0144 [Sulfurisoma sediminicola]
MKNLILAIAAAVVPSLGFAAATPYDGVRLLNDCKAAVRILDQGKTTSKADEAVAATQCSYFSWGVYLAQRGAVTKTGQRLFCAPGNATQEQVVRVIEKWLTEHPEQLHLAAERLIPTALRDAFPCPPTTRRKDEQAT